MLQVARYITGSPKQPTRADSGTVPPPRHNSTAALRGHSPHRYMRRYFAEDVARVVAGSPYVSLVTRRAAIPFLTRHVEAAEECADTLRMYPDLRIEALEFSYSCLISLALLDEPFLEQLIEVGWRGAVWGSWLAIIEPQAGFRPALAEASVRWPRQRWLIDQAIAMSGRAPADNEVMMLGHRYRSLLRSVRRPMVLLRTEPTAEELAIMASERELVRQAYVARGAESALSALRGTLLETYVWDLRMWRRASARSAP